MTQLHTQTLEQLDVEQTRLSEDELQSAGQEPLVQHTPDSESDRRVDAALKEAARKVDVSVFSLGIRALDEIFRHLSEEQNMVLDLCYRQGISSEDAATRMHELDASFPDDREAVLGVEYQIACAVGKRIAGFVNKLVGAPQNTQEPHQGSRVNHKQIEEIRAVIAVIPDLGKEAVILNDTN